MSEESLLSQLCNICHINVPKYRCPRCAVRTCSLPCTRKHKTWSSCTGVRDPAAYLTRSQLETEASFDRDFNFITGIERRLERAERDAENRGIELDHKYMLKKTGDTSNGGKKRKRGPNGDKQAPRLVKGELGFVRAAEEAGVRLVRAPAVRPCLETTPFKEAYDRVFPVPKSDISDISTDEQQQLPTTGEIIDNTNSHRNIYFYLHRHRAATKDIVLVPLQPSATLRDVLRGRSVLEFPTIYIMSDDLRCQQEEDSKAAGADALTSANMGNFVLEEVYLKDHPDEAESGSGEEEEEEEEDYTSSEGSSSDGSSDDDDDEDEEDEDADELFEAKDEVELEVRGGHGPRSQDQNEALAN
uniref:Box C/D snoRNA protein 1 n=1 Tax=Talaromyces marneffei PM1 TaxID=1077442 RepID=A0A093US92_TALMA